MDHPLTALCRCPPSGGSTSTPRGARRLLPCPIHDPGAVRCLDLTDRSLLGTLSLSTAGPFLALEELRLPFNRLTSLRGLDGAPRLRWLDVSFNNLATLEGVERLPLLKMLRCSHNRISGDGLRALAALGGGGGGGGGGVDREYGGGDDRARGTGGAGGAGAGGEEEAGGALDELWLNSNKIGALEDLAYLQGCGALAKLILAPNPCTQGAPHGMKGMAGTQGTQQQPGTHGAHASTWTGAGAGSGRDAIGGASTSSVGAVGGNRNSIRGNGHEGNGNRKGGSGQVARVAGVGEVCAHALLFLLPGLGSLDGVRQRVIIGPTIQCSEICTLINEKFHTET